MFDCTAWYGCHWEGGWYVGLGANGIIAVAYFAIAWLIFSGLWRHEQLKTNKLGRATGAIFFTCGVGHGIHAAHLLLPTFGIEVASGTALRLAYSEFHMFLWPPLTAVAAVVYWTLRSRFPALVRGTAMFEDLHQRRRQALEIHDNVVQGLAEAKLSLEMGETEAGLAELDRTLEASKSIITDLLGEEAPGQDDLEPGDLRRDTPAGATK